jgi:molybdopterin-synthase adenylyltransferase
MWASASIGEGGGDDEPINRWHCYDQATTQVCVASSVNRMSRYHRQTLLPEIGDAGQRRLAASRVLLVGCGALGTVIADQLVRAGVGWLRICDRDIVETTNLQRQVLFDESDAAAELPKAIAAAQRLGRVNSAVTVDARVVDVDTGNVEELAGVAGAGSRADLLLDGTDNVETRYLLNDIAVKHGLPWVYGACVGTTGRVMAIRPGVTPCLRCLFPEAAGPGELPTCDTAGVLGPAAAVVASLQSIAAIKLLVGDTTALAEELLTLDVWANRIKSVSTRDARRDDCPTCGRRQFEFLERDASSATSLCGRDAIQVRPSNPRARLDGKTVAARLTGVAQVEVTPHFTRARLPEGIGLTVFPDGRAIVNGTTDPARARAIYARYVGG